MGGRLATDLLEISDDLAALDRGGFWAVSTRFEGGVVAAKFRSVVDAPFPVQANSWRKLSGQWGSSLSQSEYVAAVKKIQEKIAQGWVYQVNACRVLENSCDQDLAALFASLVKENPAPYASFLSLPGLQISSASPELFLRRDGVDLVSSPIKGTQRLDVAAEFSEKDRAENVMIVDLIRNDLSRICKAGSVDVPRLLAREEHPGLAHLVSDVSGELITGTSWAEIGAAILPPGSVSGAPKSAALATISELERVRGPYCGALGWVEDKQAILSVAIRTFWRHDEEKIFFGTGAGITWASDPEAEWEETQLKARKLIGIAGGEIE